MGLLLIELMGLFNQRERFFPIGETGQGGKLR
jgi:hypothetical protein